MLLQGNLQFVFDALYEIGVIDPVLESDWQKAYDERGSYETELRSVMDVVNKSECAVSELVVALKQFDSKTLEYLAMEVAREFAEYHSRKTIH